MDIQEGGANADAGALAQSLCKECGLCCDGTVYSCANIKPGEDIDQLRKIGITTISDDGKTFALPCRSFDRICTIYHTSRARVCGEHICELLKRCQNGAVAFERAAQIIRSTKAQKEKARAAFAVVYGSSDVALRQQYLGLLERGEKGKSREHEMAVFNYIALELQLDQHFRSTKGGRCKWN